MEYVVSVLSIFPTLNPIVQAAIILTLPLTLPLLVLFAAPNRVREAVNVLKSVFNKKDPHFLSELDSLKSQIAPYHELFKTMQANIESVSRRLDRQDEINEETKEWASETRTNLKAIKAQQDRFKEEVDRNNLFTNTVIKDLLNKIPGIKK